MRRLWPTLGHKGKKRRINTSYLQCRAARVARSFSDRCVWSWNLKNEEAMAYVGPQGKKKDVLIHPTYNVEQLKQLDLLVTRLWWTGQLRKWVQFLLWTSGLSHFQSIKRSREGHLAAYWRGTVWAFSLTVKWLAQEVDQALPSNAKFKNTYSYTCTLPFLLRLLRENFKFASGNIFCISQYWGFTTIFKFSGHSLLSGNRHCSSRGPAAVLYHDSNSPALIKYTTQPTRLCCSNITWND